MPGVQQRFGGVVHQPVQRLVIASCAHHHFAGRGALGHHTFGGVVAQVLQPALVHVLQQRIRHPVGVGRRAGAVESDHDAIQRALLSDGTRQAQLEVRELCPHVQRGVAHVRVVVGLHALIALAAQRCGISGAAVRARGVGAAGHRAICADADLLPLHFVHGIDPDGLQKRAALLNAAFQLLLHAGRNGEHLRGRLHAIERRKVGEIGGKVLAGWVLHGLSLKVRFWFAVWIGGAWVVSQQSASTVPSLPVASGRAPVPPSCLLSFTVSSLNFFSSAVNSPASFSRAAFSAASSLDWC